jgi:hypothetical protein
MQNKFELELETEVELAVDPSQTQPFDRIVSGDSAERSGAFVAKETYREFAHPPKDSRFFLIPTSLTHVFDEAYFIIKRR